MPLRNLISRDSRQDLRERLIALLRAHDGDRDGDIGETTPLIKSGKLDSLGLFNLALFIEKEVGHKVDVTAYDLAVEWNTVPDILNFISKLRTSG